MLFPDLYWYTQMLKKDSFPLSHANCENWEESYCWEILGSSGVFVVHCQLVLQDKGCIALSWPYMVLPLLTSHSWYGSACFVPHATDVLAAQTSAVNT